MWKIFLYWHFPVQGTICTSFITGSVWEKTAGVSLGARCTLGYGLRVIYRNHIVHTAPTSTVTNPLEMLAKDQKWKWHLDLLVSVEAWSYKIDEWEISPEICSCLYTPVLSCNHVVRTVCSSCDDSATCRRYCESVVCSILIWISEMPLISLSRWCFNRMWRRLHFLLNKVFHFGVYWGPN